MISIHFRGPQRITFNGLNSIREWRKNKEQFIIVLGSCIFNVIVNLFILTDCIAIYGFRVRSRSAICIPNGNILGEISRSMVICPQWVFYWKANAMQEGDGKKKKSTNDIASIWYEQITWVNTITLLYL